jgi:formate dehydrogenase assembly factor FdhD
MQVQFKVSPTVIVTLEADKQCELFEELATVQEVFGQTNCGACGSDQLQYVVREDKEENKYYELKCRKCGCKLAFGQHKKGGSLFPRRKDKDNNYLQNNGWTKWEGKKDETATS